MLNLVVTLLIIALIAAILGFGGIAGAAVGIAKIVFFVAIVLFLVSLIAGGMRGRFAAASSRDAAQAPLVAPGQSDLPCERDEYGNLSGRGARPIRGHSRFSLRI